MNRNLNQIANHLEFLGYEVKEEKLKEDGNSGKSVLFITHPENTDMVMVEFIPGLILFRSNFATKLYSSNDVDKIINLINTKTGFLKIYTEIQDGYVVIRCEAIYTGDYVKDIFANFLLTILNDFKTMFNTREFRDIFLTD